MGSTTLETLLACAECSGDAAACRQMHSPVPPPPFFLPPAVCPSQSPRQPRVRAALVTKPSTPAPAVQSSMLSAALVGLVLVNLTLVLWLATGGERNGAAAVGLQDAVKRDGAPAASRWDLATPWWEPW